MSLYELIQARLQSVRTPRRFREDAPDEFLILMANFGASRRVPAYVAANKTLAVLQRRYKEVAVNAEDAVAAILQSNWKRRNGMRGINLFTPRSITRRSGWLEGMSRLHAIWVRRPSHVFSATTGCTA